jgi:hypothetical protein
MLEYSLVWRIENPRIGGSISPLNTTGFLLSEAYFQYSSFGGEQDVLRRET